SKRGRDLRNSAFCYPAELSHGFFYSLLESSPRPDYLFLPHLRSIPIENNGSSDTQACPFVQGEPFYLKTAFKTFLDDLKQKGTRLLTPFMDMNNGIASAFDGMMESAAEMGVSRKTAESAFHRAISVQQACYDRMKAKGREVLAGLAADPEKTGVVIFGRPYNAMVEEAHMGIPHKFASRGIQVIPFDFLPFENEPPTPGMYWGMGQIILKAARFVEKHPQLFGAYITNFSCGPDSFLISYFQSIMGRKPS
ncbi:MAG: acyl-CoA dehydratase activase-related protein, partial [Desulfobacterales bacterium]